MNTSTTPVLIIGAGPTGLMMSCLLSKFGIDFRVIEKREGTTPLSKALVVHARTMEIYEQLGIAQKAIDLGLICKKVNMMVQGELIQNIPLSDVGEGITPFPGAFILESRQT